MHELVTGYSWDDQGVTLETYPVESAGPAALRPVEEAMRMQVLAGRRCIGSVDFETGSRRPCQSIPQEPQLQCDRCRFSNDFHLCMTCDGRRCPRLTPAVARHCLQLHRLYLACFGGGEVKVGTAAISRGDRRLYEQGPLAAAYVACGPGPAIKRLETAAAEAGFVDSMRRVRKRALLGSGMALAQAMKRVTDAATRLGTIVDPESRGLLVPTKFVPMPALTRRAYELRAPIEPLVIAPGEVIVGEVLAAAGSLVVLDEGGDLWALDLAELCGRVVTFDAHEEPARIRPRQLSLLDPTRPLAGLDPVT